jgi:hypothetical protein
VSLDHIEDRYALNIGEIPVTKKLQVGRVGEDVHPVVQDCDGADLLLESLAIVRIVSYVVAHWRDG